MKKLKNLCYVLWVCFVFAVCFADLNIKINHNKVKEYVEEFALSEGTGYNYTHVLNDEERAVYNTVVNNLQNGKYSTKAGNLSEASRVRVGESVLADHPEYFWLAYSYGDMAKSIGFKVYNYWKYTFVPTKYTYGIAERVQEYAEEVNARSTDDARVRYVHDALVRAVSYNHEAAAENSRLMKEYQYAGSAYGALVNSSAVCAGYAKAFQLVLQRCGYDCGYITGDTEGGRHAWNAICLNNKTYYFDVTWDDYGDFCAYPNDLIHRYYALAADEMAQDHTPDEMYR